MKYQTRDFGEVELEASKIVEFVQPIFGFEPYRRFAFLFDEEIGPQFTWLQSLEDKELCFILIDPDAIAVDYAPRLPADVEQLLGEGEYACWAIAAIRENGTSSANLKSPILVNCETGRGLQLILDQDYPVRFPLVEKAEGGKC